ncbi:MAG: Unknown protein [uncultured Sulfurovum sp.]|uniref:Uncharacterized protein n=1 Tax=uncultured Sulfurovum sp. TaxID=269237 RepID=A0A6S6TRA5_9BACT|nr:MAG: Unknown protein [uncultured Sulfurovum sp.]
MSGYRSLLEKNRILFLLLMFISITANATSLTCSSGYTKYDKYNLWTNGQNEDSLYHIALGIDGDKEDIIINNVLTSDTNTLDQSYEQFKFMFTTKNCVERSYNNGTGTCHPSEVLKTTAYTKDISNTSTINNEFTDFGKIVLPKDTEYIKLVHRTSPRFGDVSDGSLNSVSFLGFCYKKVPKVETPEATLTCSTDYTKYLKDITTSGRNDSSNLVTNLFNLDNNINKIDIEKVWTYDGSSHVQPHEQFKLAFTNNSGAVLAQTGYTTDVDNTEGAIGNTQFTNLGSTELPAGNKEVKLVHRADTTYADNLNYYNSVTFKGMCYKLTTALVEEASVDIEVATNGSDADKVTGPNIGFDETVTWTYVVKNTGNIDLTNIVVTDNKLNAVCTVANLVVGASKTCTKIGKAIEGQYENIGTVKAKSPANVEVTDTDPSHYIGGDAKINPPVVDDDVKIGKTGEAVTLDTLVNDKGIDSELNLKSVVLTHVNAIDNGKKLIVKGEGIWTVNSNTGNITFTPEVGYTDDPTFVKYTVEDLNGNVSNEGTERINYPQTSPITKDDTKIGERCKAVTVDILSNDSDPEDDLNISSVNFISPDDWVGSDTDNDGDIDNVVVPNEGTWSVNSNGQALFTPSNECSINPTAITYSVTDKTKEVSNKAMVTVIYPEEEKSSVGNLVWFDADKNGEQNRGESGLSGVTVELYDANDELNATTITDENGAYAFVNIDSGEYAIKFFEKEGYSFTMQNAPRVAEDYNSDADTITGKTEVFSLSEGENNISIDAGMYIIEKPSIKVVKSTNGGDVVNILVGDIITWTYVVTNTGNTLLSDIVVTDDKEGNITNCVGDGSLEALNPTKSITCTKTGIAILGAYQNQVVVEAKDTEGKTVESEDISSYVGKDIPVLLGTVGDYVWLDSNRNGIQDVQELPLQSVAVHLFDKEKKLIASTKSDATGKYLFKDVLSGEYYVKFTVPSGYTATLKEVAGDSTKDSNANSNGTTGLFTLAAGANDLSIDLGLYPKLTNLGDRVFLDTNANGIQEADEKSGVANVTVKLYREDNTLVAETQTTSTGLYVFRNILPTNYYVVFEVPSKHKVSPQNQGANESTDSDTDASGKTGVFTLLAGQDNKSIDMGLYQEAIKLGDRVFYDTNKNGIQEAGETGVADVVVNLYSSNNNEVVATTKTSASGIYLFDNVVAGEYYIIFTKPVGYTITKAGQGSHETDSNADASGRTENFILITGTQDSSIDMGIYQDVVSYGDRVFLDTNHNGLQDAGENGVKDVNVTITSANSDFRRSMLTDENGNYLFRNLPAGEYSAEFRDIPFGYLITERDVNNNANDLTDSDGFLEDEKIVTEVALLTAGKNDLSWDLGIYKTVCLPGKSVIGNLVFEDFNKNGMQDIGESGVAAVKVALFNNDTEEEVASTTTDENGLYEFAHVDPEFNYYIQFTVPNGFTVSPQDQDDEIIDSDADENGKTDVIVLEADQINSTVDMGIYREGSMIGDRVFFDELNGVSNGIQEAGEQGVHDIKVTLFKEDGTEVNSTRTNVSGEYRFTNVPTGRYTVEFSELPAGYIFTLAKQGNDDEKDSDVSANGRTDIIVVNGKVNVTSIDAGLKKLQTGISANDIKSGVTGKNVTLDVLANDTEGTFNFDASTVKITSVPDDATLSEDGRTLTVPNEGVWRVNPDTGAITFTPAEGFVGDPTSIAYTVQDSEGNETGADVEVNYPPLAVNDNVNAEVGTQIIIYVLENDSETSSPLDITSLRLINPVSGDEVETVNVVGEGTWNVNMDGSVSFTPDAGFVNNPSPIEYVVREAEGDLSNRATISITYPDAVDDTVVVPRGTIGEIVVNVSENDSNNTVPSTVTIGCEQAGVETLVVQNEGTWNVTGNGSITFTPEADFVGEPTDIEYTIGVVSGERSNCATVDIRHELLAMDDTSTLNVGPVTLINILTNDFGSLNAQSVELVLPLNPVAGSTLSDDGRTLTVPDEGVWTVDDRGIVSFTAEDGFSSVPTSIRYTVENNNGLISNIAIITLTEGGVSVVANDDIGLADNGNPIIVDVLNNDTGDLNNSSVRIISPDGEEVRTLVVPGEGTWTVNEDGSITFTGESGFVGTPTPIKYIVSDNSLVVLSDTATVTIDGICDCRPYETSIPAMGQLAGLAMLILTLLITMLVFKEEDI